MLPLLDCHPPTKNITFPVLLEELATPFPHHQSYSWKNTLASELLRDAHSKYDNIINTVGHVCRDLEQRCLTVETPLQKATDEIEILNLQIENFTREKLSLEENCTREKEGFVHELRCVKGEIEGCQRELAIMSKERDILRQTLDMERGQWVEREEEFVLTNRVLDDELKESQEELVILKKKVCHFVLD
jgi:hypothetical protein